MSESDVTREGLTGTRPGRDAMTGVRAGRRWPGKRRGERPVVPRAEFTSYYGKPILNPPVWESPDIPGYLFLGGLAGGSSLLAAGADVTGRGTLGRAAKSPALAAGALSMAALVHDLGRAAKSAAFAGGALSVAALVHDLGRPARFLNMMRVFKVTSPMSVGSWLLAGYVPAAAVAALSDLTGRMRGLGAAATAGAAALGPAVAAYTAALISDTAVPAWHDGHPEMPFVFTGSAAMAAGGLGLLAAPLEESAPARNLALLGVALETAAFERMEHRIGMVAEPYSEGRGGRYITAGKALAMLGAAGCVLGRRRRPAAALAGAALPRRLRRHPVGHLPRGDGVGRRPEIHGHPATRAAGGARRGRGSGLSPVSRPRLAPTLVRLPLRRARRGRCPARPGPVAG